MSEVRLVDGNALMDTIRQHDYPLAQKHGSIDNGMFTIGIQQVVDEQPTITPESLGWRKEVHGRWENTVKWWQGGSAWKRCSVCGIISEKTRYCRNCGTRMIEKTDCPHQG